MASENLRIKITAIDKTKQAFASVRNRMGRFKVAVTAAAAAAGLALNKTAGSIDNIAKTSARLGLTAQQLQSIQFAAGQTGVSAEELNKGLSRFARNISEANSGIGTAKTSFETLGISLTDSNGKLKDNNDLFEEVTDAFQNLQNPADRIRVAYDLFGRSGEKLVNTLSAGSGGIKEMRGRFTALTFDLTQKQASAVEAANDRFSELGVILSSIGQQIAAFIMPIFARFGIFLVKTFLNAVSVAIEGARRLANSFVFVYNHIADVFKQEPIKPLEFGKETQLEIDQMIAALNKVVEAGKKANKTLPVNIYGGKRCENIKQQTKEITESVNITQRALQQLKEKSQDTFGAMQDIGVRAMGNLEDSIMGVIDGTKSAKEAFSDMAKSILDDIIRMQIKKNLTGPLSGLLDKALGTILFDDSLTVSDADASAMLSAFEGAPALGFAEGGVTSSRRPYMVGEKGPELFVPNMTGRVVPNSELDGGSSSIVVNQTLNIETGVSQTVRAEIKQLMPQISEATKAAVLDARRRGGKFANAFA